MTMWLSGLRLLLDGSYVVVMHFRSINCQSFTCFSRTGSLNTSHSYILGYTTLSQLTLLIIRIERLHFAD